MINEDSTSTYSVIVKKLKIDSPAVRTILHDQLYSKNIVSKWVPHKLTAEQKQTRVEISKDLLKLLKDGGHQIIFKIVTGDETYISFRQEAEYSSMKMTPPRQW